MRDAEIIAHMRESGALLEGHFQLRSGLHSSRYFQCALVLQHPAVAAELGAALAEPWRSLGIETVVSPAVGGIVVGQEVARALGARAIFAEKDDRSELLLRRGFALRAGERVLVAEDVVTRGGRVAQTIALVRSWGAVPVGACCLVDRSGGAVDLGAPFRSLLRLDLPVYEPAECPMCAAGTPLDHPGSR